MTLVDGIRYFDIQRDETMRKYILTERSRLIGKMLLEKGKAKPGDLKKPSYREEQIKHCLDDE